MRSALLLCLVVTGCASLAPAPAPVRVAAPEREESLERFVLRTATAFETGRVGAGASTPASCLAYRALLRSRDAAAGFRELLEAAEPAGRLDALCGLREVAPATAESVGSRLVADDTADQEAVAAVLPHTAHPLRAVREKAVRALRSLTTEGPVEQLERFAASVTGPERERALQSLERLGR